MSEWHSSACILCECNCGIKVELGGEDGRHITRIRGDEDHPASHGYLCQKASGLDHYQNGKDRLSSPLRRTADGGFEEIDWDTAIVEIAERLLAIKSEHGGQSIFYYGGGGQGNHLPGGYSAATRKVLGSRYRSNALAQEKTGEFWVNSQMFGQQVRGDFEHCEVGIFLGKNPWHSHGIPRARAWLKEFSKDPARTMIVIDPVVSETAKLADFHLRVKPGTDAWLLSAMVAVLCQDQRYNQEWLSEHALGLDDILEAFDSVPITEYCNHCGIAESEVRQVVDVIAGASSIAMYEDLGVQMNRHSTLVSYLEKLLWVLRGHFGKEGGQYVPVALQNIAGSGRSSRNSPVAGAPIISGLVPCNVITEEILTDHPDRYRAMIVETANPVHSLADSDRMREALRSLDLVVAIDIAMTETCKEADYILPASTQYEKWEATFFNFEYPDNYFHLRKPLFAPLANTLSEAEIHARLIEAMGALPTEICDELSAVLATSGRNAYRDRFMQVLGEHPDASAVASIILYRTLGPSLANGAKEAALLWPLCLGFAMSESEPLENAGYSGDPMTQADKLFDAIVDGHSGVVFSKDAIDNSWRRIENNGFNGKVNLVITDLLNELVSLKDGPDKMTSKEFPYVLMAGERRDYSANTIFRDGGWRRKDRGGALRMSSADAQHLGLSDGDQARINTQVGTAITTIEINDRMQPGHMSLPNGFGLDNVDGQREGVAANELTSTEHRDKFAGTPWHKYVAAQVSALQKN